MSINVITEDRASGAQVIDGSLKFDGSQELEFTPGSDGNLRTATWSFWVKRAKFGSNDTVLGFGPNNTNDGQIYFNSSDKIYIFFRKSSSTQLTYETTRVFRDTGWYHIVVSVDTTQASGQVKLYVNGEEVTSFGTSTDTTQNADLIINDATYTNYIGNARGNTSADLDCMLSNVYLIDGQRLDASYFGFTDGLTNTWRPKKYEGTFGTNGFWLPMDGNSPIAKDQSDNGNDWTPVNFGGSNSIEKATGALPIMNTVNGGDGVGVGVRTDTDANDVVLALPLVGINDDVSNQVNSTSTTKSVTTNGDAHASSDQSNFYGGSFEFDGTGDYLSVSDNDDFHYGSDDFTAECWVYPTASPNQPMLMGQWDGAGGGTGLSWAMQLSNNSSRFLRALISSDGSSVVFDMVSTAPLALNKWSHCAFVRSGNTFTLYLNGHNVTSTTNSSSLFNATNALTIGATSGNTQPFQGYLQDVRVYKGTAKYTDDFIPAATNPDILPDTPSGVSGSSKLTKSFDDGSVEGGGTTSDYLQVSATGHSDFSMDGDFTVEWFMYRPTTGNTYMWTVGDSNTSTGLELYWGSSGATLKLYTNGGAQSVSGTAIIGWSHYAVVRSGSTITVYYNGTSGATSSNSNTFSGNFTFGEFYSGGVTGGLIGPISNFRYVKGTAVYTSNFTPPTEPLTAITNTKLLCFKSNSSATEAVVKPADITTNGTITLKGSNPFNTDINAVRGQETGYATWNPLLKGANTTLSDGNLTNTTSGGTTDGWATSTILIPRTGKYYVEFTAGTMVSNTFYGMYDTSDWNPWTFNGFDNNQGGFYGYQANTGEKYNTGSESYGDAVTLGDTVGALYNADDGTLSFTLNGVSQGVAFSSLDYSGDFKVWFNANAATATPHKVNFGQKPFKFPPPEGYTILSASTVLPANVIPRADQYFDTKLYTGTTESPRTISGLSMTPDMVWVKNRTDDSTGHYLFDTVRGDNNNIRSDGQFTQSDVSGASHGIISTTGKNSFTVKDGSGSGNNVGSTGSDDYVAWCWKAGGNESTFNVDGVGYATAAAAGLSCTADLVGASIGTKQGFSIIRYQATSGETVAHGLSQQPGCIFMKNLDTSGDWNVYHSRGGDGYDMASNEVLNLNNSDPMSASGSNTFITGKSATTFTVGSSSIVQNGSDDFIAYCWHDVPGLQKFGHWKANNSTNGNFLNLGFRPGLIIAKQVSGSGSGMQWFMLDSKRNTSNPLNNIVDANRSDNERQDTIYDFVSNGAKIRIAFADNEHFIYMAWAEAPSFNLYGAQSNAR